MANPSMGCPFLERIARTIPVIPRITAKGEAQQDTIEKIPEIIENTAIVFFFL